MIFFERGGGAHWPSTMGQGAHYYFKRGTFSQQQIQHLGFIYITSYSILNIHQVFMLIEIPKIQFIGAQEVKSFNKPCGHEPYWRLCYY